MVEKNVELPYDDQTFKKHMISTLKSPEAENRISIDYLEDKKHMLIKELNHNKKLNP